MSGHEAESAAKDAAAPAKSKFSGKIKILVFVLVGMGLQAVAATLFFSKGSSQSTGHTEETAGAHGSSPGSGGHGGGHGGGHSGGHGGGHGSGHAPSGNPGDLVEAEVGDFSCTVEVEDTATLFYLSFKLHAMVTNGALNSFKDSITGSHKARLRQAVVKVVRMSSIAEIREAQLDLFKRSLTTEMNNVLPQRFINDVVLSEIRVIQQQPSMSEDLLKPDEIEALLKAAGGSADAAKSATRPAGKSDAGMIDAAEIDALFQTSPTLGKAPPRPAQKTATERLLEQAQLGIDAAVAPNLHTRMGIPQELGDPSPFDFQSFDSGRQSGGDALDLNALQEVDLDLRIELGRTELLIEEVLQLKEGSVVPLNKLAGDPVDILVNGRLIARGEVLVLNDNFCVRIAEILTPTL